jgi:hypothetical protein
MHPEDMMTCPFPYLVEGFRIRCTRVRKLISMNAPKVIMDKEHEITQPYRDALAKRGATAKQIAVWELLDLTIEDAVGRPWCHAMNKLAEAMLAFLRVGGSLDEIEQCTEDALDLYEMETENEGIDPP